MPIIPFLIKLIQMAPEAIAFANRLLDIASKMRGVVEQHELDQWMNDLEKTIDELEKSKTPETRRAVARNLVGIIRRL
jgi:hypothetical protein